MKKQHAIGSALLALGGATCLVASSAIAAGAAPRLAEARSPVRYAAGQFTTKLSGYCPDPLVVQTNWLPEADHAALYELIGAGGTMKQYSYEGPIGSTGIRLDILSGGPGDAYLPTAATLYTANPVSRVTPQLSLDSIETTVQLSKKFPTVGVVNLENHDPQVLIYNPARWRNLGSVALLAAAGKKGAHFYVSGLTYTYVQYLIKKGVPAGSFIGGYSGDLEKFVTGNGMIVNQGYADSEPYLLAHDTPAWGAKPVKEVFIYKLGLNNYPEAIQVAAGKLKAMSACLSRFVPLVQKAEVDYFANPSVVNKVLAKFNPKYSASYWTTPVAESEWADKVMTADQIVGNSDGGKGPLGAFDMARLGGVVGELLPIFQKESPGTYLPGATAAEIATNEFIDRSVRLP